MKERSFFLTIGCFAILLMSLLTSPLNVNALLLWNDNFDDGNYVGWTIVSGNFTAENDYLEVTEAGEISHPSNLSTFQGTLKFDIKLTTSTTDIVFVTNTTSVTNGTNYFLRFEYDSDLSATKILLARINGSEPSPYIITSYTFPNVISGWTHIDMRYWAGAIDPDARNFEFFVNSSLKFDKHAIFTSAYFVEGPQQRYFCICSEGTGAMIDNLFIYSTNEYIETVPETTTEPTTSTPTPTPTPTGTPVELPMELLFIGGGAVVVLVVIAVIWKRKS
ncbi:MAG: hypothetical protein ACFFCX_11915 [Candidatus Sifarchaeia archaeon]